MQQRLTPVALYNQAAVLLSEVFIYMTIRCSLVTAEPKVSKAKQYERCENETLSERVCLQAYSKYSFVRRFEVYLG